MIDCRARKDFTTSHVDGKRYSQWLSVPEEVIKSGLVKLIISHSVLVSFRNLTTFMSSNNHKLWEERGTNGRSIIVLVDEKTSQENIDKQKPISLLKEKLEEVCSGFL